MFLKLAEEKDREDFIKMSLNFFEASPFNSMTFDRDGLDAFFDLSIASKREAIVILLVSEEGKNVGMVAGIAQPPLFSKDIVATELAWWVDEEYRKTRKSIELLLAFDDWGKRIGAFGNCLASIEGFSPPSVDKYYTNIGYSRTENSYFKRN
jgi:hypothetical protein